MTRMLIVDDEPTPIDALFRSFAPPTPELTVVSSANDQEAMELMQRHGFEFVLADLHQPDDTQQLQFLGWVQQQHPDVAVFGVGTMDEIVRDSLAGTAFYSWLVGSFAALALVVACAGIYGVMSSIVAARTREFGIRLALGCDRRRVERLVLRHAAVLAAAGLAIGAAGAVAAARFLESLVVGASRLEAATMTSSAVILVGVALVAAGVPARRAARVDPMQALRQE